jgi:hypothetical protein
MQFNAGDTLKLTGKSGNYRTVNMLFPAMSQNVEFTFMNCSDADSNHYAIVQIGAQVWLAENLKTTKYRDGSDIPNVTDSAAWSILITGAYCNFHNDPAEGETYGHLYNYYAVDDSRKMCPAGWHVPSTGEWNILEKFLDATVDTTALEGTGRMIGRILKEGCDGHIWIQPLGSIRRGLPRFARISGMQPAPGAWRPTMTMMRGSGLPPITIPARHGIAVCGGATAIFMCFSR